MVQMFMAYMFQILILKFEKKRRQTKLIQNKTKKKQKMNMNGEMPVFAIPGTYVQQGGYMSILYHVIVYIGL